MSRASGLSVAEPLSAPRRNGKPFRYFLLALLGRVVVAAAENATAPLPPIVRELQIFNQLGSVLYVAAHPDDESNLLLAQLARGRGLRTAYLSLTRGDGGQNELGPEFAEKLGLARSYELLAARQVDGARQYFTRALDYGFSKDVNEALRIWEHQKILGDVVRIYRLFRPDVVIRGMSPTQTPGQHGQHVASAVLAIEAFKLAGDPKAYPEHFAEGLTPWQPKRIVGRSGGGRGGRGGGAAQPEPTDGLRFESPAADPGTGENLNTVASRSRAMHKTQFGMSFGAAGGGGFGASGSTTSSFTLTAGDPGKGDLLDGVDLTFGRYPGGAEIAKMTEAAIASFRADDPAASVPALLAIRAKLAALPTDPLITDKRSHLDRIIETCLGLSVETTLPNAEVVPGEAMKLLHHASLKANHAVKLLTVRYPASKGAEKVDAPLTAAQPFSREAAVTLPAGMRISQPYWLREEPSAGLFRVDDPKLIGLPENPPAFPVEFVFSIDGQTLIVATEPVQVIPSAPPAQQRRRLTVISPVALGFPYQVEIFKPGATKTTTVEIVASRADAAGKVKLTGPAGWKISPETQAFALTKVGDTTRVTFEVTAPAHAQQGALTASAQIGGAWFSTGRFVFNYPHIPLQVLQPPARLKVASFDFAIRGNTVGYLAGAGDSSVEHLEQLGYTVKQLSGADLSPEKLRGIDAVVIGVRAFNERDDLERNLPGLFAWVEQGGTVIAQYNRPDRRLKASTLGPYPLSIQGSPPQWRVTDETAAVSVLQTEHSAVNTPNKIADGDFNGWVQERGAYFPSKWDEAHYTSLLAMSDPGEAPLKGSVLVAKHGKGYYVYTGLAFFRQLPAGVPGAYRLFANLVSLGKRE